jgi:colanic acid biosynthesis protein WcaH
LVYDSRMNAPRFLAGGDFARIVRLTPLVSIDLVVKDPQGRALVGLRVNEPAKGKYFVPGRVILKNETIQDAFARILTAEIGIEASLDDAAFLGVFEHFYDTNRFGDPDYGTHYVVLAYEICLDQRPLIKTDSQHSHVRWMSEAEICREDGVHPNTKAYFSLDRSTAQL